MKKWTLILLVVYLSACSSDSGIKLIEDEEPSREEENLSEQATSSIPTMEEILQLFEGNIRGHFQNITADVGGGIPLEDFVRVIDEENYYIQLDYSTESLALDDTEFDAAITLFVSGEGAHLVAYQSTLCPRSFIPCHKITDFYHYENGNLEEISYDNEPLSMEEILVGFPKDNPKSNLGYYLDLPRFDAVLRVKEGHTAFDNTCSPIYVDVLQSQIVVCDYHPNEEGGMTQELIEVHETSYTPGFTIAEYKWNGEIFQLIQRDWDGIEY